MDYLITNGYPQAAEKFAAEANIQPSVDSASIRERIAIRRAIHSGDIQSAIEQINELNPQVCFSLYLFEALCCMIRTCFMHHSYTLPGC